MWQRRLIERDRRLRLLASFVTEYEAEQGAITPAELAAAALAMKKRAIQT